MPNVILEKVAQAFEWDPILYSKLFVFRKICTMTYSSLNFQQNKPVSHINMKRGNPGNEAPGWLQNL